jgi:threonyl-tRNA synthetase
MDASALMKRRKSLATLAKSKPEASADQVQRFERRLREVKQAVAGLPGEEYYAELLKIIQRAGWTTLAEGIFFEATMESILAHTRDLAQLHQKLKAAFEAVQGE